MKKAVGSLVNFNNNNSLSGIKRQREMKRESSCDEDLICLDSPPSVLPKKPFKQPVRPSQNISISSSCSSGSSGSCGSSGGIGNIGSIGGSSSSLKSTMKFLLPPLAVSPRSHESLWQRLI